MVTDRKQQRSFVPMALLIILSLMCLTFSRNGLFQDPLALWEDTARKSPGRERPHYNLGTELKNAGKYDQAQKEWERTLELNPLHSQALNQLGSIWFMRKEYDKALFYYHASVQADLHNIEACYNLAMTLEKRGEFEQSMYYYERFLRIATPEYQEHILTVSRKVDKLRSLTAQ